MGSMIDAVPMYTIRDMPNPQAVLERLMRLLIRLGRAGIVHGDFNEFNLLIGEDPKEAWYLPKKVDGVVVLVDEDGASTRWRATNDNLHADTSGLAYRKSKDINDEQGGILVWGRSVVGFDAGDWVKIPKKKVTLIDFPQIVHLTHLNAREFFDRDVRSTCEWFRKKCDLIAEEYPSFDQVLAEVEADDGAVMATLNVHGISRDDDALLVAAHGSASDPVAEHVPEDVDDEDDNDDDEDGDG